MYSCTTLALNSFQASGDSNSKDDIQAGMGKFTCTWALLSIFAFALTPITASALPGEADAVVAHCGQPTGENQATSAVTGLMQRDLTYNGTTLHFEPMGGGWSFTTAWHGHLPMSRTALEARMPCFRDAMQQVAAAPKQAVDPTIAIQSTVPQVSTTTFGISFLWVIAGLGFVLLLFVALPSTRRRRMKRLSLEERPFRRPKVLGLPFLRRKRMIPKPTEPKPTEL